MWINFAVSTAKRKDYFQSSECYKMALKEFPDDPVLLNNFAWSLLKSDPEERSFDTRQQSLFIGAKNTNIVDTYAKVLIANEKYSECIKLLKPLDTQKNPDFYLAIAQSYEKTANQSAALTYYGNVLKIMNDRIWKLDLSKEEIEAKIVELQSEQTF